MPFIHRVEPKATAGTVTKVIANPKADSVILKNILVYSSLNNKFCAVHAYLVNKLTGSTHQQTFSDRKWAPDLADGIAFRDIGQEWEKDMNLTIVLVTQAASDAIYYCIEYELIKIEKKGWW